MTPICSFERHGIKAVVKTLDLQYEILSCKFALEKNKAVKIVSVQFQTRPDVQYPKVATNIFTQRFVRHKLHCIKNI